MYDTMQVRTNSLKDWARKKKIQAFQQARMKIDMLNQKRDT